MDLTVNNAAPRSLTGQQRTTPKPDKGPKEIEIVFQGVVTKLLLATEPAGQSTRVENDDTSAVQQSAPPEHQGALLDKKI